MKRLLTLLCGLIVAAGMKPVAQAPVPGAETASSMGLAVDAELPGEVLYRR